MRRNWNYILHVEEHFLKKLKYNFLLTDLVGILCLTQFEHGFVVQIGPHAQQRFARFRLIINNIRTGVSLKSKHNWGCKTKTVLRRKTTNRSNRGVCRLNDCRFREPECEVFIVGSIAWLIAWVISMKSIRKSAFSRIKHNVRLLWMTPLLTIYLIKGQKRG